MATKRAKQSPAYGVCPRCGQVERLNFVDGTSGMAIHMKPDTEALIECGGVGWPPAQIVDGLK